MGNNDDFRNGLSLIEGFMIWRKDNISDTEKPLPKNLRLEISATKPLADDLKTFGFTLPVTITPPHQLDAFEASPPAGHKVLVFSAEFATDGWHLSEVPWTHVPIQRRL